MGAFLSAATYFPTHRGPPPFKNTMTTSASSLDSSKHSWRYTSNVISLHKSYTHSEAANEVHVKHV